ncbi:uncharacterized protein LOC114282208 [Camellia sinensis]|uniref:uncharacterized protein LOC114282208 n=1 Tax=Camellia sinensis TaxID=4442 RepID=UPI0010362E12|nr:uncharacterized protein LOC114282208 [Camellia sinensis]
MIRDDLSDSDTQEYDSNSSSEDLETPNNGDTQKMSEYEKQRMKRMESNRARMEALGLQKMASSLMGSVKKTEPKGKAKIVEEDEEYKPPEMDEGLSSSSDDEEFVAIFILAGCSFHFFATIIIVKKKNLTPKSKVPAQKLMSDSDFVDDDEALMQAIALSLKDSVECSDVGCSGISQSADLHLTDGMINERKGKALSQEDTRKRKRKKPVTSRVQMTEDELVLHFFQFDESGKGGISLRDLKRVAAAHDFTWKDNEMVDMIYCFDSNGDGKLSLDDFRKIVGQCNMIQVSENSVIGSKAR